MRRYVVKVLIISVAAATVWGATAPWTRPTTIAAAKWLHVLVGFPAPYLLADLDDYYWFAPLFPPLVGLVVASHWVSVVRRVIGLVIGVAAFWYLVALQVAVVYSPYLTLSAPRAYLMSIQVALNSVVVPVLLWLIVTGGPPQNWNEPCSREAGRSTSGIDLRELIKVALLTLLLCAVMTSPVPIVVAESTPTLDAVREDLARSIIADSPTTAVRAIDAMLEIEQKNAALSYLQMEMYRRLSNDQAVARLSPIALTTAHRQSAYRKLIRDGRAY